MIFIKEKLINKLKNYEKVLFCKDDFRGVDIFCFEFIGENNEFEREIEFGDIWCLGDFDGKTTFSVLAPTEAQNADDLIINVWISSLTSKICEFILSQISINSFSFDSFSSIIDEKLESIPFSVEVLLCSSDMFIEWERLLISKYVN